MTFHPQYTRLCVLGEGGYGKVSLAQDREGTLITIKQAHCQSLKHEQLILPRLQEHSIVGVPSLLATLYDVEGSRSDGMSLVLEYVEGQYMRDLTEHSLMLSSLIEYLHQFFSIIADLHRHGIVHHDIHDANVPLGKDHHIHLIDYGISHVASTLTMLDKMFQGEVVAMILTAKRWITHLTPQRNCPLRYRILIWLDKTSNRISYEEEAEAIASSFLASWRQMLQTVVTQPLPPARSSSSINEALFLAC